jgi:membrane fusion protein (multidrug efflux system)
MNKSVAPNELQVATLFEPAPPAHNRRKKLFASLAAAVLVASAGFGAYELLVASHYATTDNAYVGADSAQVTPRVEGAVARVLVNNTDHVRAGQVVIVLDDDDARLQLAQAEAALSQAERRVEGWFANDGALAAQVEARQADQARAAAQTRSAGADLARAKLEYERRANLARSGAVSGEELTKAQTAFQQADAALISAKAAQAQADANRVAAVGALQANRVLTARTDVRTNPEVVAAQAKLEQARLQYERTVIRSPVSGVVTNRQVQVGQRIQPGASLMTVVPVQQAYVDANFKEGQLAKVRPGQRVELVSDLYGDGVKFHGRVAGMSGGTGSAFALIPAQNATGNWIKVVQRVPVRVLLEPAELQAHPLRVGLSMTAKIHLKP